METELQRAFAESVERLSGYFERVVVRRSRADAANRVASIFGITPPAELAEFLELCDGISIRSMDVEGTILGSSEMAEHGPVASEKCANLLPIRNDGCGSYDCIVASDGTCAGAIVFWDHEVFDTPSYLVAGSLHSFLRFWADELIVRYLPSGKMKPEAVPPILDKWPWLSEPVLRHPWPFDEQWLRQHDPIANAILSDPARRAWLANQDENIEPESGG